MASIIKYCGSVTQTTGGNYRDFSNLNNIKTSADTWATSNGVIRSKSGSPNRPSTISCTNFNFSLPEGAEPTKVTVSYRHGKLKSGNTVCNIPAPTVTLLGVSGFSGKGVAPSTTMTTSSNSFTGSALTRNIVNSSSFGVKLEWGSNTNTYEGRMTLRWVTIEVEYKLSSYQLGIAKSGGSGEGFGAYNNEDYSVAIYCGNTNLTSYEPTLTLTAPAGFNFVSSEGAGTITNNNNNTYTWQPNLSKQSGKTAYLTFHPEITWTGGATSATFTFTLSESLNSTSTALTATITDRPVVEETVDEATKTQTINSEDVTPVMITADVGEYTDTQVFTVADDSFSALDRVDFYVDDADLDVRNFTLQYYRESTDSWVTASGKNLAYLKIGYLEKAKFDTTTKSILWRIKCTDAGLYKLQLYLYNGSSSDNPFYNDVYLNSIPASLQAPEYVVLEMTSEECNRLGDGYTYNARADKKITGTETPFKHDWGRNCRMGIFNNAILANVTVTTSTVDGETVETITDSTDYTSLTNSQIFENAEYWSEYGALEVDFPYNQNYPLYLIFTGDYAEATTGGYYGVSKTDMGFGSPKISENKEWKKGPYPTPILNTLSNGGGELTIPVNDKSQGIIYYDLPLGEYEGYAIQGLELTAEIDHADQVSVEMELSSPEGITGQRSVVLNDDLTVNETLKIGGMGDLWGYTQDALTRLTDYEAKLTFNNIFLDGDCYVNYGNVKLSFYLEKILEQEINCLIEGEDLSYYGAFIQNVDVPEGLETDTKFLTIDGTDTNDGYQQNIRQKTITVEFTLDSCDLEATTLILRQLTRLLVNRKDSLNRPIPKRMEFSHYPDIYWEYIMTDPLDVSVDITGYTVKAKLVVPAGTAYSKEDAVTNSTGFVNGLAAVNPIIQVIASSNNIEITEDNSEQSFKISNLSNYEGKIIEVNTIDKRVWLKDTNDDPNPTDISRFADFNSDWFSLYGQYSFSTVNCTLLSVTYTERW